MFTDYSGGAGGSGSIRAAGSGFAAHRAGAGGFRRPAQLDPALVEHIADGVDPEVAAYISRSTAEALLDRVRHTQDAGVVERTVKLVETEGADTVAQLWSSSPADSLPGILWRLYMLRTWMRKNGETLSVFWRAGEPDAAADSAVAGINYAPDADDIASTADSILSGAFTGDFAVALERAAAFCSVVCKGMKIYAQKLKNKRNTSGTSNGNISNAATSTVSTSNGNISNAATSTVSNSNGSNSNAVSSAAVNNPTATYLAKNAKALSVTTRDFTTAAALWRENRL